jgi:hypothetical protein
MFAGEAAFGRPILLRFQTLLKNVHKPQEMSFRTTGVFAGRRNLLSFQHEIKSRFLAALQNDNSFSFLAAFNRV